MQDDIDAVKLNYGKCAMKPEFFDTFYDIFVNAHSSFAEKFKNTDLEKQKRLLKDGINYMIMFAGGSPAATNVLNRTAQIHDHDHIDIRPEYYGFWIDSLIAALKKHDEEFTADLEAKWRRVMQPGIDHFVSKY